VTILADFQLVAENHHPGETEPPRPCESRTLLSWVVGLQVIKKKGVKNKSFITDSHWQHSCIIFCNEPTTHPTADLSASGQGAVRARPPLKYCFSKKAEGRQERNLG
jgi:hypothetical protein